MSLMKNPRIIILIVLLFLGILVLIGNGLKYGLDFSGGTQFILTLDHEVTDPEQMQRITSTISQRLDWSGLKDVKVASWDNKFITAQVAVSDPEEVAKIEEILQKQGKFENIFEGKILFTGDDIISVLKDPQKGYGVSSQGNMYRWTLPFVLNAKAAKNFAEATFHKCVPAPSGGFDCPKTYFFIDRPANAVLLIPSDLYKEEEFMPADPLFPEGSKQIKAEEILENTLLPYFIVDKVDENLKQDILKLKDENSFEEIIVPYGFDTTALNDLNMKIVAIKKQDPYPWLWTATGLKSVVWLTENITNQDAPTMDSAEFKVFYNLLITGSARTQKEAQEKLNTTFVLLAAGSLPVGVESISKETISPSLGKAFLNSVLLMGIIALLAVALVIYIRYRNWRLVLPLLFASGSEVFLVLAFASLIKWQLDLAALAGIIAAVGTGVDDQIIITDELSKEKEDKQEHSLLARVKRAFFIIFATATTTFATMFPIILFGFGLGKLVGFALTTIAGVLIGILITRPAYAEMAKYIMSK